MFHHLNLNNLQELTTENINNKRNYVTPIGKFPSITSILSSFPNPSLMEWRKRIGETEANRISKQVTSRGTKFHSLCEQYLKNEDINRKKYMPDVLASFAEFKPLLSRIGSIHHLEAPLYSERLKCAGRVDLISQFDSKLSIVDFKTSRKTKKEEWIESYFLQAAFYSLSYAELTGLMAKQLVILISVDDGEDQVFIKETKDYVKPVIEKIRTYYELYHVE